LSKKGEEEMRVFWNKQSAYDTLSFWFLINFTKRTHMHCFRYIAGAFLLMSGLAGAMEKEVWNEKNDVLLKKAYEKNDIELILLHIIDYSQRCSFMSQDGGTYLIDRCDRFPSSNPRLSYGEEEVNKLDTCGFTPLHYIAMFFCKSSMISIENFLRADELIFNLVKQGADFFVKDRISGKTAAQWAQEGGRLDKAIVLHDANEFLSFYASGGYFNKGLFFDSLLCHKRREDLLEFARERHKSQQTNIARTLAAREVGAQRSLLYTKCIEK
jgi:hypothetical protein